MLLGGMEEKKERTRPHITWRRQHPLRPVRPDLAYLHPSIRDNGGRAGERRRRRPTRSRQRLAAAPSTAADCCAARTRSWFGPRWDVWPIRRLLRILHAESDPSTKQPTRLVSVWMLRSLSVLGGPYPARPIWKRQDSKCKQLLPPSKKNCKFHFLKSQTI